MICLSSLTFSSCANFSSSSWWPVEGQAQTQAYTPVRKHVYTHTHTRTHTCTHTCTRACARNRDRDCLIYLVDFSKIFCVYVCVLRFHYALSLCLTGDFSIHRVSNYVCFFILNIKVFPEIWKILIHCLFPFPFHFSFLVWHFDSIICMSCFRILYPRSTPCCISVISGLYSSSFIPFHLRLIWSLIHHWAFKSFFFHLILKAFEMWWKQ